MQAWDAADKDSQELDLELQKVAVELEQQTGLLLYNTEAPEEFATPDNWQTCADDLNSTLAAFGFDHSLQLQSQQPEDLATTCNVVHALLVQRQRDVSQRAQFEDHFQRMRSDLNVSEQTRDRLRSQLDAKQREHGALLNQWRVQEGHLQGEVNQLTRDRDDAQKHCADLQRRHAQAQHELRRKDMEAEKLKEQLRNMLMERKREAKKAFDMAGAFSKDAASRHVGKGASRKGEESTIKMVVSSYETRQGELMQENKGLQAALSDLQSDYRALANKQAAAQQLHAAAVGNLVDEEEVQAGLPGLDPSQLQKDLSFKMAAMKKRIAAVYDGPLQQELQTSTEKRLFQELQNARALTQEQAVLAQTAMTALSQHQASSAGAQQQSTQQADATCSGDGQVNTTEVTQLRAEYASRIAAAAEEAEKHRVAMSHHWHAWEQEQKALMHKQLQDKQQQVDATHQSLLAQQQQLKLKMTAEQKKMQQQEQALLVSRQQFEQEQLAAKEALRSFAPGFGAGKLLAEALTRRTAKAAQVSSLNRPGPQQPVLQALVPCSQVL